MFRISIVASCILACAPVCLAQTPAGYVPLTQDARFHRYLKTLYSPEVMLRSAAGAAIDQAANTPSEWGQGADGYARRFGNSYAQHVMRQTITFGASSMLNEDNRYFRSERHGFRARALDAVKSTFLARRPDGKRRLSYSRIGAAVATAFISREWQPRSTDGAQNALDSIATTVGTEVGFNVFREFAPNILHH